MDTAVAGVALAVVATVAGAVWHLRNYVDQRIQAHEQGPAHATTLAAIEAVRIAQAAHGERLARIEEGVRHVESAVAAASVAAAASAAAAAAAVAVSRRADT